MLEIVDPMEYTCGVSNMRRLQVGKELNLHI